MEKPTYPTDELGLPVIPDTTACYEVCLKGIKDNNRHHLAWPRVEYSTRLERRYREAGVMAIRMCVCRHEDLHSSYEPPQAPTRAVMDAVVMGDAKPQKASEVGVTLRIRTKEQVNEDNCYAS